MSFGVFPSIPSETREEVELTPELVVSVFEHPVVFCVFTGCPLFIPPIVKVMLSSTPILTTTPSIVVMETAAVSSSFADASNVDTLIFDRSPVPTGFVLDGFMIIGLTLVQVAPVDVEHPIKKVITVPLVTLELVTHVIDGADMVQLLQVILLV